jgi:N-acetylmuramoyl-L-alanine amidase
MIRKIFALGIAGASWLLAPNVMAAAADAELRGIAITTTNGNAAQVTLDLSSVTSHKLFTLDNPNRVVVDLRNTRLASGTRLPSGTGVIEEIRTGEQARGTLRVVMELKSAAPSRAQWVAPSGGAPGRLIVAIGKESPLAQIAPPGPPAPPTPVRAAHAPTDTDRDVIIAIDAGHGGPDPGAIGRNGTREKDVVLAVARELAERINDEPGMRAVLTRDSDHFLVHRERIRRARVAKADMFVSVHADSIRDRSVSGSSVYVLSDRGASSEAARWLAEQENAADLIGGVSLADKDSSLASVLMDLSQTASISASMSAAERVLQSLHRVGEVRKPKVQQAGFLVLKSPDIPSMLVETAYISNPAEESRLKSAQHQGKLAGAIFSGIRGYFETNPPNGTRFAQMRRGTVAGVMADPTVR